MRIYSITFLFFLIFFLPENAHGQALDSLERAWQEITDDSVRYAQRTKAVWTYYDQRDFERAERLAASNLRLIPAEEFPELSRKTLFQLSHIYAARGASENFKTIWAEASARFSAEKDTLGWIDLLYLRAGEYTKALRYDSAYSLYEAALTLAHIKEYWYGINTGKNNQAIIFAEQGLLVKAKEKFYEAALAGERAADTILVFIAYHNVARCFIETSVLDSAAYYIERGLAWQSSDQSAHEWSIHSEIKARLAAAEGDYPRAFSDYHRTVRYLENDFYLQAKIFVELGKLHFELAQYDSALFYLEQAIPAGERAEINEVLRDALPLSARSHAAIGEWQLAYERADQALRLRDEHLGEEVQRQVAEMEARYELENLRAETAEQARKVRQRTWTAGVFFCAMLLIFFLGVIVVRKNQAISSFNQSLEAQVDERTKELADANAKLQEYLNDLQMFTHITSHDLKEPLRNISGFSSLLQRRLKHDLTEDTATFLDLIKTNAVQMHDLIEGIQFYAGMHPQRSGEVPLETVSLQELAQKVEKALATGIDESGAEIVYATELPAIRTAPHVIMVVLKNLVENAIKYNRSSRPRVTISYERQAATHRIIVRDNGIGIAPEYQNQVFEMFKRLHSRKDYSGTGMGLGISRKLVRRFAGDITLTSKEGAGSTFVVSLPVTED